MALHADSPFETAAVRPPNLNGTAEIVMPPKDDEPAAAPASARSDVPTDHWVLKGQVVASGPMQRVCVSRTPFSIGRSSNSALALSHPTVSGSHAEIFEAGGLMLLRDAGSRNGTFLNGLPVTTPRPLRDGDLIQFAELAFLVAHKPNGEESDTATGTVSSGTVSKDVGDSALALMQFEKLMQQDAIVPHYQPIVAMGNQALVGAELLGRSRLVGLQNPASMFKAAQQFDREVELSRLLRKVGLKAADFLSESRPLFVNTHPLEVGSTQLLKSLEEIRRADPMRSIVLEIHEAAVTSPGRLAELRGELTQLDMGLAYDDFGAGQTRLRELVDVQPDFLKFDMGLIRDIDTASESKRHTVKSLVAIALDLGITTLAEGVETEGEHAVCLDIGFELGQGYYYGKPTSDREWVKTRRGA